MTKIFADTSFYIAFSNPRDQWHDSAAAFAARFSGAMVTTEFVLVELANHLCSPRDRGLFLQFHQMLRTDAKTEIVPASSGAIESGIALYAERPDKAWSLTDCISMHVMRAHDLTDVLTTDRHFRQAGFNALLQA